MSKVKSIIIYVLSVLLAFVSGLTFAQMGITKALNEVKTRRYGSYRSYYDKKES